MGYKQATKTKQNHKEKIGEKNHSLNHVFFEYWTVKVEQSKPNVLTAKWFSGRQQQHQNKRGSICLQQNADIKKNVKSFKKIS